MTQKIDGMSVYMCVLGRACERAQVTHQIQLLLHTTSLSPIKLTRGVSLISLHPRRHSDRQEKSHAVV